MKKTIFLTIMLFILTFLLISCLNIGNTGDSTSTNSSLATDDSDSTESKPVDTSTDATTDSGTSTDTTDTDTDIKLCEHLNSVVDIATEPSCSREGLTEGSHCNDCGEVLIKQEVIPMLPHTEVANTDVSPTCKKVGFTGGTHCSVCKVEIEKATEIPTLPHTVVNQEPYAPTCKKAGMTAGKYCSVCFSVIEKQTMIDKLSHTEIVTKAVAPTCQSVGYTEQRQCEVCKEITLKSIEIPKIDHTIVIDKAKDATCSSTGLTEGSHCSDCNQIMVKQEVIGKNNNHIYDSFANVTKVPSFSSSGTGTITCSLCKNTQSITFNKLSASKLSKEDIYSIETDKYNPAYDNRWKVVDGKTTVSSIYSAGDWFGNVGDVLVITLKQEMAITGLKIYTAGNYTTATIRVKDSSGNVTLEKGITANGASNGGTAQSHTLASNANIKAYTKTLKVSELEITASKLDTRIEHTHSFRELVENTRIATCTETGIDTYECFCGKKLTVELEKIDHVYGDLKLVKLPTCIHKGYKIYECVCGQTSRVNEDAKGHAYFKLVSYSIEPTVSNKGKGSFKCNNCSIIVEKEIAPLPIEEIKHLRVEKIENGKIVLRLNVYGDTPDFEIRYSATEIDDNNYQSATTINAEIDGTREITITLTLNASLNDCYYIAIKPYKGSNFGKISTVRVGGNSEITIDYDKAQVYHGEILNSFRYMFDGDIETQLGLIFANSGDTKELYGSKLSPIVDLEYMHYVTKASLYYNEAGISFTVRWSDTPLDFQSKNKLWDGYKEITSKEGWNEISINQSTRYIQIIFTDGEAPCEVKAYGYQCGEGDEISTKDHTLPTIGQMLGMCGFVAAGGGNTPIDSVICAGVLREYHNFGWSYSAKNYGNKNASFFTGTTNYMGNFESQYRKYKEAGLNVIPCIQWSLGNGETISYKVDESNRPIYSGGSLVKATFWERFNPHTYFVYADNMFAFSARFGTNKSNALLAIAQLHCLDEPSVGQGTIEWIEMGNEPEGGWNGIHNYLSAYQLAAATSAAYDGHCKTLVSPVTGGYHLGGKNADANMKLAMAGVSGVSNEYITALCYWMKANRMDGKTAFDAFNVHHYMTKSIELPNGSTASVGISPEEAKIDELLSNLIEIRDKYYPEKEVWITEFGWDTNQSYATSTSSHAYGEYTGRQVQATYLILSAIGIDKADMYMCEDTGVEETSVGKYGTSGVIAFEYNENGEKVEVKKDSYYYLYTLKNALGYYSFDSKIEAYDENVNIYKYKTDDGKTAFAVWCKTSNGTKAENYQLSVGADSATLIEAEYGDIDGVSTSLKADEYGYVSVNVSENPIYIIVD